MSEAIRHTSSPKERVQILTLYGAAIRVYARYFDEQDAETATLFWTGWHVTKTLRIPAPLIRLGLALERDPREIVDVIARYHPLTAREPAKCERAYREFLELYDQIRSRQIYTFAQTALPMHTLL